MNCQRLVYYTNKSAAKEVVRRMRRDRVPGAHLLRAYSCACGGWHVGNRKEAAA